MQSFKISFYAGALLALIVGFWLVQLWQAEKQVRLHSEHFISQIEQRDWSDAMEFLATDYHDDWGHDRAAIRERLRMVLRCFTSLTITAQQPQVSANAPAGWWSAKVQIEGNGNPFAPEIVQRVNSLAEPFVLHWRRVSWRPWDWKLVRVSNPSLEISDAGF
ncbi:MAG: nuclear transport factor 2 family protein [Spartobacteria bacterium]